MHSNHDHPQDLLRQSEDRFSLLFRKSPIATSISSIDTGRFFAVNDAWSKLFGFTPEEVAGQTALEMDLWVSSDSRCELLRILRANGSVEAMPAMLRMRSRQTFEALISTETIELNGGQYLLSLVQEAASSHGAEAALAQAREEHRALAHSIAHDFNNLLAMILGCAELVSLQTNEDPKLQKYVDRIIDAAQRGKSISQRLLLSSESGEKNASSAADSDAAPAPPVQAALARRHG